MKYLILAMSFFALISCASRSSIKIEVKNPSSFNRLSDICEIDLSQKTFENFKVPTSQMLVVKDSKGNLLPSQETYDNKLIFQPVLKAGESKEFQIWLNDTLVSYESKVEGRLYPERQDDFAWENDRVGFRFYGATLKSGQAPSGALDLFYKRTPKMILDKWYEDDISGNASYHVDHGEGCDPYNVGASLGAGGTGLYVDGKLIRNISFDNYQVIDKGPLRMTFQLKFPNILLQDSTSVIDERIISIDAGSQLTKIQQNYGDIKGVEMAAGIVRRPNAVDSVIVAPDNTFILYKEPTDPKNGSIYISLVFPDTFDAYKNDTLKLEKSEILHSLALKQYNGTPITYYTGYGWDKFGFDTIGDYEEYVSDFVNAQKEPFQITYNNKK